MLWMSVRFGWGNTAAAAVVAVLPFVASSTTVTTDVARDHHRLNVEMVATASTPASTPAR
jgi:hypothetical protein